MVVFGRSAGLCIESQWHANQLPELKEITDEDLDIAMARYRRWDDSKDGESVDALKAEMQQIMQDDFGVFRTGEVMEQGLKRLDSLRDRLANAYLGDKSHVFNTARVAALELDNLMATAYATAKSALTRTESRGAHSREDFTKRDDATWIKHIIYYMADDAIDFRPVNTQPKHVPPFEPKERVY